MMGVSDWGVGGEVSSRCRRGFDFRGFYPCFAFWSKVMMDKKRTGNCVISSIFGSYTTISIAVEAGHGLLGEEGKRLLVD